MNPFDGISIPIDSTKKLFGRKESIKTLRNRIAEGKQTVIMGVEGVGKTSLLKSCFDRDYRITMAKENVLISSVTEFNAEWDAEQIYCNLTAMMRGAVQILSQAHMIDIMEMINKDIDRVISQNSSWTDRFTNVMNSIHDIHGYRVVFVIDNFEAFTSSPLVTSDLHSLLNGLLDKSQYVIATNYDLNSSSLPNGVKGSFYLMKFAGGELALTGISEKAVRKYVDSKLQGTDIKFSDEVIHSLWAVSGGIPYILNIAARAAYSYIEQNGSAPKRMLKSLIYDTAQIQKLMERWCLMLNDNQIAAIRIMTGPESRGVILRGTDMRDAGISMNTRGLLKPYWVEDDDGVLTQREDAYDFNCQLFSSFCRENDKRMEKAAMINPLRDANLKANLYSADAETAASSDSLVMPFGDQSNDSTDAGQNANLQVQTFMNDLQQLIAGSDVSRDLIVSSVKTIVSSIGGVSFPVDFTSEIPIETYAAFSLTHDILDQMLPDARKMLDEGIRIMNVFEGVKLECYGPVCIEFCKALEIQVIFKLLPVMKKALKGKFVENHNSLLPVDSLLEDRMELGTFHYILTNNCYNSQNKASGCGIAYLLIKEQLFANGAELPNRDSFWKNYIQDIKKCSKLRNLCPHKEIMSRDKFHQFINTAYLDMFRPDVNACSESFFVRTNMIYKSALECGLLLR